MSEKRERRILEVAERHFSRFGYKKTVLDELVQEVGIAKGTFYLHFKSKRELLRRVVKDIEERVALRFYEELAKVEGQPAEQVRMMVRFSLEVLEEYPMFAKLLADEPETQFFRELLDRPERKDEEKAAVAMVQGVLADGIAQGIFREDIDQEVVPYLLGSLKMLFFYRHFLTGEGMLSWRQFVDGLADMATQSLLARPLGREDAGSAEKDKREDKEDE